MSTNAQTSTSESETVSVEHTHSNRARPRVDTETAPASAPLSPSSSSSSSSPSFPTFPNRQSSLDIDTNPYIPDCHPTSTAISGPSRHRPTLACQLLPPQTIVSPPSPIDPQRDGIFRFSSPSTSPLAPSPSIFTEPVNVGGIGVEGKERVDKDGLDDQSAGSEDKGEDDMVQYDSPEEDEGEDSLVTVTSHSTQGQTPRQRQDPRPLPIPNTSSPTSSTSSSSSTSFINPVASDFFSTSPMSSLALLTPRKASPRPHSPSPSDPPQFAHRNQSPSFNSPLPLTPTLRSSDPPSGPPSRLSAPLMLHHTSSPLSTSDPSTATSSSSAFLTGSGSGSISPRLPSPSSPDYHPHRSQHRRESSTHKVRETTYGEQRNTEDGHRMVNQYKIGTSLGKGAYATVELGVDSETGKEYAIKEFSKSRLSHQSLVERQQRIQRQRARRSHPLGPRGLSQPLGLDGKRKAGTTIPMGAITQPGTPPGVHGVVRARIQARAPDQVEPSHVDHHSDPTQVDIKEDVMRGGQLVGGGKHGEKEGEDGLGLDEQEKKDPLALIRREIAVMKKLDHPNIIHLYEAISVPNADSLFLVLEYLPGGVLMHIEPGKDDSSCVPPFDLDQTREYFRQLCMGLEYLHTNGVVHRDIKPDNILLSADRQSVKLCDFGVSEMFTAAGDDRIKKSAGSPAFLSPESITTSNGELHGMAVDIWALGVVLYCMLAGKLPFNVSNPIDLFRLIREAEPHIPDEWDDSLKDLVKRKLDKNPETRIAMSEIRNHPWVTANGTEPMISTEDNLYYVGKHVEEPTPEEIGAAFTNLRSVFTVVRAVQKMKRLHLHRRSVSGQTQSSTPASPGETSSSPNPSAIGDFSAGQSQTSGSMDSYVSQQTTSTTDTKTTTPPVGGSSPQLCESPGETIREDSARAEEGLEKGNKEWIFSELGKIVTREQGLGAGEGLEKKGEGATRDENEDKGEEGGRDEDVVLVDSPTEE